MFKIRLFLCVVLFLVLTSAACGQGEEPSATPESATIPRATQVVPPIVSAGGADSPEAAVIAALKAIEANDVNAYLDVVDPQFRSSIGNYFFFSQFMGALTQAIGLGSELGQSASQVAFRDLTTSSLENNGTLARVHVTGYMRSLAFATETPFEDVILTRQINGRWYISQVPPAEAAAATATASAALRAALEQVIQVTFGDPKEIPPHEGFEVPYSIKNASSVQRDIALRIGMKLKWDPGCYEKYSGSSSWFNAPLLGDVEVTLAPGETRTGTIILCCNRTGGAAHYNYALGARSDFFCPLLRTESPRVWMLGVDGTTVVDPREVEMALASITPTPTVPITTLRELVAVEGVSDFFYDYESYPKFRSWDVTIRNDHPNELAVRVRFRWLEDTEKSADLEMQTEEVFLVPGESVETFPVLLEFKESETFKNGRNVEYQILQIDGRAINTPEEVFDLLLDFEQIKIEISERDNATRLWCIVNVTNNDVFPHTLNFRYAEIEYAYTLRGEKIHNTEKIEDKFGRPLGSLNPISLNPGQTKELPGFFFSVQAPKRVVKFIKFNRGVIRLDGNTIHTLSIPECQFSQEGN